MTIEKRISAKRLILASVKKVTPLCPTAETRYVCY